MSASEFWSDREDTHCQITESRFYDLSKYRLLALLRSICHVIYDIRVHSWLYMYMHVSVEKYKQTCFLERELHSPQRPLFVLHTRASFKEFWLVGQTNHKGPSLGSRQILVFFISICNGLTVDRTFCSTGCLSSSIVFYRKLESEDVEIKVS